MRRFDIKQLFFCAIAAIALLIMIAGWVASSYERKQRMVVLNESADLISSLKVATTVKDELTHMQQALSLLNQPVSHNQEIAQNAGVIVKADKRIMRKLIVDRQFQGGMAPQLAHLSAVESDYQVLHQRILNLNEHSYSAQQWQYKLSDELHVMQKKVAVLVADMQDELDGNATRLTHDSLDIPYKIFFGCGLLVALIVLIAYYTYQQLGRILGCKPEHFFGQLNSLFEDKSPFSQPASDSVLAKIGQRIHTDDVTGLLNSRGLKHWLFARSAEACEVVLFLVRVEELRSFCDCNQDDVFNQHLKSWVNFVASLLPEGAVLARFNDDTLAISCTTFTDNNVINRYLEHLSRSLLRTDFIRSSPVLKVRISAASFTTDLRDPELLIQYAELALAATLAKNANYMVFESAMLEARNMEIEMMQSLRIGLSQQQFFLVFQPQVDCRNEKVVGAEALIRWLHPEYGLIAPNRFIAVAEKSGLINEIGSWVLDNAIHTAALINTGGSACIPVSINVSPSQFLDSLFVEKLSQMLTKHHCDAAWIKVEITEGTILYHSEQLLRTMFEIADKGIAIVIDDFGTGYSSLSYLAQYPISQIKIDRSFIKDIDIHLEHRELVRAIVRISQIFHNEVVVEGVETEEQLHFVREANANIVQGYYYYKPMPYEQLCETIALAQASKNIPMISEFAGLQHGSA